MNHLFRIGDLGWLSREPEGPPQVFWLSTERGDRHKGPPVPGQLGFPVLHGGELIFDLEAKLVFHDSFRGSDTSINLLAGLQAGRDADALLLIPNALLPSVGGYVLGISDSKLRAYTARHPRRWQFWRWLKDPDFWRWLASRDFWRWLISTK